MARRFTATTDVVYLNNNGVLAQPTVYTVGFFARGVTVDATSRQFMHHGSTQAQTKGDSTQTIRFLREFAVTTGIWGLTQANHGVDFNDGNPKGHSVVISHNGAAAPGAAGDVTVWADGLPKAGVTLDTAPAGALTVGTWNFWCGNNNIDGTQTQPNGGEVYFVWMGDRAPTDAEVAYYHLTGIPPFDATNLKLHWPLDGATSPEPNAANAAHVGTVTGTGATRSPQLTAALSDRYVLGLGRTTLPMMRGPRGDLILHLQQSQSRAGQGGRRIGDFETIWRADAPVAPATTEELALLMVGVGV